MNFQDLMSDQAILEEMGNRLAEYRLGQNLTQKELAAEMGVSLSTLVRLEDGRSVNTLNLIRILRGLGLLSNLETLLPRAESNPIDLLKRQGKKRQRASRKRIDQTDEVTSQWNWGDE